MSLRKTLLVAILFLGALYYVLQYDIPREAERAKKGQVFSGLTREAISSIEISAETSSFTLNNTKPVAASGGENADKDIALDNWRSWELAEVPGSQLDRSALNGLLTAILGLKLEEPLPKDDLNSDLSVYGLVKPELTVAVKVGDRTTQVQFGKNNDYVSKRYVRIAGEPDIYLLGPGLFSAANHQKIDFRNRNPIEFIDADLQQITLIDATGSQIKLKTGEKLAWRIVEPGSYSASENALSGFGRELRGVHVSNFIDSPEKLATYGLEKPSVRVRLEFRELAKREPVELALGLVKKDGAEKVYAQLNGQKSVLEIDGNPISKLLRPVDDFRERELFKFATDQAVQLDFELYKADPVSLIKKDNDWLVNGKPADTAFVEELLRALSGLRADTFPNDNRDYGFGNPRLKVVVRLQSGGGDLKQTSERLLVIGDSAGQDAKSGVRYYAASDDRKEPFIINKDKFKAIFPRLDVLQKVEGTPTPSPKS
ncbi:MAG: DUF4340 domain-containing protein [Oligoflexia bacterium]|nr:DUF4340 domain-containing protein [Oligoflexia bacterium]